MIDHDRIASDIRAAAEEVFSTMLSTELRFAESYCDKGPSHPLDGVICLIGMAGEWTGTGTTSCSAEFACRIASQMLMAEYTVVDAEVLDAVAEIANMILGNVKTALEKTLGTMGMSIPTAIFGKNFLAKSFGDESWSVVVFDCDGQRLEVKLFLKPAPGAPAPGPAKACAPVYLRG
jgi:chemotaxis protein CheX